MLWEFHLLLHPEDVGIPNCLASGAAGSRSGLPRLGQDLLDPTPEPGSNLQKEWE
jgi:hypothetical protein